jgi:hypothetical protein
VAERMKELRESAWSSIRYLFSPFSHQRDLRFSQKSSQNLGGIAEYRSFFNLGLNRLLSVLRRRRLSGSASILSFLRSIYPVGALLHQLFDYPRSDASLFSHKTCWFHILLIDLRGPIIHIYGDRLGSLNILSPFIPRLGLENGSTRRNCKVRITVRHLPGRRSLTLLTILALNP